MQVYYKLLGSDKKLCFNHAVEAAMHGEAVNAYTFDDVLEETEDETTCTRCENYFPDEATIVINAKDIV